MDKQPCVYILSSDRNDTLYVGVTSDPVGRIWQHREHVVQSFTSRYWRDPPGLVRDACHDGVGDIARKAHQEVEAGLENAADR
ncbi:MAG TPA: GIY-YIG nuclease family protein [Luteimonas sp.]|nr:GIY-YIG nuclease family protein [Luteimonas sp.]